MLLLGFIIPSSVPPWTAGFECYSSLQTDSKHWSCHFPGDICRWICGHTHVDCAVMEIKGVDINNAQGWVLFLCIGIFLCVTLNSTVKQLMSSMYYLVWAWVQHIQRGFWAWCPSEIINFPFFSAQLQLENSPSPILFPFRHCTHDQNLILDVSSSCQEPGLLQLKFWKDETNTLWK